MLLSLRSSVCAVVHSVSSVVFTAVAVSRMAMRASSWMPTVPDYRTYNLAYMCADKYSNIQNVQKHAWGTHCIGSKRDTHQCTGQPAECLSAGNCQIACHTPAPQLTYDGRQVTVQTEHSHTHTVTRQWMRVASTGEHMSRFLTHNKKWKVWNTILYVQRRWGDIRLYAVV